ncbi:helix-turn-helix domain-containing protein [Phytohabitans sp. ZYX-F-186]|uniref:Helix-turn-helix domain-containing protein n=1 Tax=Phytohabitans maris TaxID=3071409 RepID=A0ABU0ZLI4_9ACTN|nr:helix-turn-helix domain-containing protein [Phytohabitans sp. ZYX-F-186]MDQ7907446.1 helix-turn-helix domain-containing protein [Phytohabitans sp. ZYX-F-186]
MARPRTALAAAERRRQLADLAAGQFHRRGFHQVSLAGIASSAGLTAPAIYRHFENKQALLAASIDRGLDVVAAAWTARPGASLDDALAELAIAAEERRDLWTLLQREMRHLDQRQREPLEARFNAFAADLRRRVHDARPECDAGQVAVLSTALLAVLSSPSVYSMPARSADRARILGRVAGAVYRADLPHAAAPDPGRLGATPGSAQQQGTQNGRRAELLDTAIALFHDRGYAAVSLDDIGAAVGMAGPSIYYHFPTKGDLLVQAFTRATEQLTTGKRGKLEDLAAQYIELGVRERLVFGVYVLEAINLPPEAARRIKASLDAHVAEWCRALAAERPELSDTDGLVLVHAARAVVHDVVRVGHLHERPTISQELRELVHAVLYTHSPSR